MNRLAAIVLLGWAIVAFPAGPTLGTATNVVVVGVGVDGIAKDPTAQMCKDFKLSISQAESFLNSAAIVTRREIHDFYDHLPCFVHGTADFHGYPAKWKIRAGGTGVITLYSGEDLHIVDERQRNAPH